MPRTHRYDKRHLLASACTAAALLTACGAGEDDDSPAPATFAQRCEQLIGQTVGSGRIASVTMLPASDAQPQTCSAQGRIVSSPTSTIKFQIELPVDLAWNHKLIHMGGGGFNGFVASAEFAFGGNQGANVRQRGYALIGSDSGHEDPNLFSLSFARNNPTGLDNFNFNSAPQVYTAGIDTIKALYGKAPDHKYFYGGSTGGREALQQAQRFPEHYDGVIALKPVVSYDAVIQNAIRIRQIVFGSGSAGWVSPAKVALFDRAQLARCDDADGIVDGIVSNPAACHFDSSTLRCPDGGDTGDTCFSDAQLASVEAVRTDYTLPMTLANGMTVARRFGVGAEADALNGWTSSHFGADAAPALTSLYMFADQWLKHAVTSNDSTTVESYRLGSDAQRWQELSAQDNATNPDLSGFAGHGGKLILWHGWSDHIAPPGFSIDYYDSVVSKFGQPATDAFMRFYTAAGVAHGGGGPGPAVADMLTALENWSEKGIAPADALIGAKYAADGSLVRTMPVCRYPSFPKYKGAGASNDASSFTCTMP